MSKIIRDVVKVKSDVKVDEKTVAKNLVLDIIVKALSENGITSKDGKDFGFTASTIVAELEKVDVQVKLITAKAGMDRYALVQEK